MIKDSGNSRWNGQFNRKGDKRGCIITHGCTNTRLYEIWCGMKKRCYNPKDKRFNNYGGRGIEVCNEWKNDFQSFFEWAVLHDYQEGKGKCDLLPLDVVAEYMKDNVLHSINYFHKTSDIDHLMNALNFFMNYHSEWMCKSDMILEVAKHFEDGAKKYGENNWQKGIPVKCYIDSAIRHYLKYLRGDDDERHDRAFCWNIMCAIWTCNNKPELNDYAKSNEEGVE